MGVNSKTTEKDPDRKQYDQDKKDRLCKVCIHHNPQFSSSHKTGVCFGVVQGGRYCGSLRDQKERRCNDFAAKPFPG